MTCPWVMSQNSHYYHSLIMIHLSSCKAHLRSNHLRLYLSDQGNDGKNKQWYYSLLRQTNMVRSYNGTKRWCHVRLKIGRSSSLQSQDMDIDMVLLLSEGEMGHSPNQNSRSFLFFSTVHFISFISHVSVIHSLHSWSLPKRGIFVDPHFLV